MTIELANTLIRAVDAADSSASLLEAVRNLSDAKLVEAIPTLIAALGYNNPGAAVAAVDGLIGIGKPAVTTLLELLDGYNYGARAWAIRALAGIGDPRALDRLLEAAQEDFALSVRRAAARGLGTVDWSDLPADRVYDAQVAALTALIKVSQDHEWVVRYAAITGLQELAIAIAITDTDRSLEILAHFDRLVEVEDTPAVIARIWLAQKEIQNYAVKLLKTQSSTAVSDLANTIASDWQSTLERLYARKSQERPFPEGDPRRFREVAAALGVGS
jgi:phycocyanobilin lyase beta subunit